MARTSATELMVIARSLVDPQDLGRNSEYERALVQMIVTAMRVTDLYSDMPDEVTTLVLSDMLDENSTYAVLNRMAGK